MLSVGRRVPVLIALGLLLAGCDDVMQSPKLIEADGATFVACKGTVWASKEAGGLDGSDLYRVSFTDREGSSHMLRGIHKVSISDLPKFVDAPMPLTPSLRPNDGASAKESQVYHWEDGTQAIYRNGKWEPVKIQNPACAAVTH